MKFDSAQRRHFIYQIKLFIISLWKQNSTLKVIKTTIFWSKFTCETFEYEMTHQVEQKESQKLKLLSLIPLVTYFPWLYMLFYIYLIAYKNLIQLENYNLKSTPSNYIKQK